MKKHPLGLSLRELSWLAWQQIWDHELPTRAGSIAFFSMLAALPLIYLTITLAAHLLPDLAGSGQPGLGNLTAEQLQAALKGFFPDVIYTTVNGLLLTAQSQVSTKIVSLTLIFAIWAASSAFTSIIDNINRIYGIKETRPFWSIRLTAIWMALIQAGLMFVCMTGVLISPRVLAWLDLSNQHSFLLSCIQWVPLYLILIVSYALTFHMGPDAPQRYTWITPGAVVGAFVFLLASWLFRLYVDDINNYTLFYGTLGSVVALMMWFWIISWILLGAAQINRLVAEAAASRKPSADQPRPEDTVPKPDQPDGSKKD